MVRERRERGETLYACEACGFAYRELHWAEECEAYCRKYDACSLEITRHAVRTGLEKEPI